MITVARFLVIAGLILILVGGLVYLAARVNLPLGRLPGDIRIQRDNFTCFFPLATSIVLSLVLTLVLNLIARLLNK
jgi:H+/Cl- antiporter ClcA